MRVLVTGGAGYIGSHAARELARHGHSVLIYDNLSTGHRFLADGFELIEADLSDSAAAESALRRADAVMHFAAHSFVGESVQNPRKYFENNVRSALSFLNVALDAGIKYFIFSSTCAVYGVPRDIPIAETAPRQPVNPYGASKLLLRMRWRLIRRPTDCGRFVYAISMRRAPTRVAKSASFMIPNPT